MLQFQEKRNVIKKETEKILKHRDLTIEIQRMCGVTINMTSAIIGATGTISKPFMTHLSDITGKHAIKKLYKKPPYQALHKYCGKCWCKCTKQSTWEITLLVT
jgi:hypothetical protein